MSSPDILFCSMIRYNYDSAVALINTSINLTPNILAILKNQIKFYENFVLDVVDENLAVLEEQFLSYLKFTEVEDFDRFNNSRMKFCQAAYSCTALIETLFPADGNDPTWVANSIPLNVRNELRTLSTNPNYALFQQYVCKLSLRTLLDQFRLNVLDELEEALDELLEDLGINKIDEYIERYFQAIAKTKIFDYLDQLDKFANCFLDSCDFVSTASNLKEDTGAKLSVQNNGGLGWSFTANEYINGLYTKESDLRTRISSLKSKLVLFRTTKIGGSNTLPDEITKA